MEQQILSAGLIGGPFLQKIRKNLQKNAKTAVYGRSEARFELPASKLVEISRNKSTFVGALILPCLRIFLQNVLQLWRTVCKIN